MLRPSYSELMELLNDDRDLDNQITSRYTIVIAAAKRARQIVGGATLVQNPSGNSDKAVSVAVNELESGLVKLYPDGLPQNIINAKLEIERQKMRFTHKNEEREREVAVIEVEEDDDDFTMESYVFEPDEEAVVDEAE